MQIGIKHIVEYTLNWILRRLQDLFRMVVAVFLGILPFCLNEYYHNPWYCALIFITYPVALWLAMTSWETFKEINNININLKIKL